jgi:Cu(I)/Ag(I) efflux system membrane protein CusA/SilA
VSVSLRFSGLPFKRGWDVIYLEEAVRRNVTSNASLTIERLHEAVMEGSLLRLRPKVITVATVVAVLLPIMWSNRRVQSS